LKNLIVIPARAGSKRILNKNLTKIGSKPLIHYSIKTAIKLRNKVTSSTIVTISDSKEIKSYAKKLIKNKFDYNRPKNLSKDNTTTSDTVNHLVKFLSKEEKLNFDYIILLQPTSPIRNEKDILQGLRILEKKEKIDSVVSISDTLEHIDDIVYKSKKRSWPPSNIIKGYNKLKNKNFFTINGNFYITRMKFFKKNKTFFDYSKNTFFLKIDKKYSLDIDDNYDLYLARKLFKI
jgi:CMP-N,N'-diacetyllegionaminic acid synthase